VAAKLKRIRDFKKESHHAKETLKEKNLGEQRVFTTLNKLYIQRGFTVMKALKLGSSLKKN
jgi:hypothetical protein